MKLFCIVLDKSSLINKIPPEFVQNLFLNSDFYFSDNEVH